MLNIYNSQNHNNSLVEKKNTEEAGPNKRVDIGRYVDPSHEFDANKFRSGVWYVTHKVLLYKITVWSLTILLIGLWSYSLFAWGNYLIFGIASDQRLAGDLSRSIDYTRIHPAYAPKALEIVRTDIFSGGVKKFDIVAEVVNPNLRFQVAFDFYFTVGGEMTKKQSGFLLPNQDGLLPYLGISGDNYPSGAELVIENIRWKRIDQHKVADTAKWQEERLRFSIENFLFFPAGGDSDVGASVMRFDIINNSAFGYSDAKFNVGLYQGSALVGVLPLSLDRFKAGEIRSVDLRSFVSGLDVSGVKLYPLIDIYNRGVYLLPEA